MKNSKIYWEALNDRDFVSLCDFGILQQSDLSFRNEYATAGNGHEYYSSNCEVKRRLETWA